MASPPRSAGPHATDAGPHETDALCGERVRPTEIMIDLQHQSNRRIEAEIDDIAGHRLPDEIVHVVDDYDDHVGKRDRFLWKWIHALLPHVTLSSVPADHAETVRDAKTVASMFVVLADDVGERDRDEATLREVAKIPFDWQTADGDRPGVDSEVLATARRIWSRFEAMLDRAPRGEEFRSIFEFDVNQTLTAIEYSFLVNENLDMANERENWIYECNNMMLFPYVDVDLMFSSTFDRSELSVLRQAVRRAQKMARIGNWVTTWERELDEGDFTSGVVVSALANDLVTSEDLHALQNGSSHEAVGDIVDIVKDQNIEQDLLDAWGRNHQEARALERQVSSVDLADYLDGMETVLQYHLVSRGLK